MVHSLIACARANATNDKCSRFTLDAKMTCEYLIGRSSNRKRSSTVNLSKSLALQQMNQSTYECDNMQTMICRSKSAEFDHISTGAGCSLHENDAVGSAPVFELHTDFMMNHPLVVFVETQR